MKKSESDHQPVNPPDTANDNRSCTDVLCCLIFIIFIFGLIAVGSWAFAFGSMGKLMYPTDSAGDICGMGRYADKKKLVFFNFLTCIKMGPMVLTVGCLTRQVCVKKCPDYNWIYYEALAKDANETMHREKMICMGGVNALQTMFKEMTIKDLVANEICAAHIVKSGSVAGRCLPLDMKGLLQKSGQVADNIKALEGFNKFTRVMAIAHNVMLDFVLIWRSMIVFSVASILVSLFFVLLMRCLAKIVIYLIIFLVILALIAATGKCIYQYIQLRNNEGQGVFASPGNSNSSAGEPSHEHSMMQSKISNMYATLRDEETWLTLSIALGCISIFMILLVIFLWSRIVIAVGVIAESSRTVSHMLSVFFWPIIPGILKLLIAAVCLIIAIYLYTIHSARGIEKEERMGIYDDVSASNLSLSNPAREQILRLLNKIPCEPGTNTTTGKLCQFLRYGGSDYTIWLQLYTLFMFFWLTNFAVDFCKVTLAGAFAGFYFSRPGNRPSAPLASSLWRTFRYHMGSIAFGSLIVSILEFFQAVLTYIERKCKESKNVIGQFLAKCLICFFWCLEKCLRFLNKNAYIMIAIYGNNFCSSARTAFSLLLRNALRAVAVESITSFLLFLGRFLIAFCVGFLALMFYDGSLATYSRNADIKELTPELHYPLIPALVVGIVAYFIASVFFDVYKMAVDTIFLCFLQDLEMNDGSPEKPYFMQPSLMATLGKKNEEIPLEKV